MRMGLASGRFSQQAVTKSFSAKDDKEVVYWRSREQVANESYGLDQDDRAHNT
jgi:hypothetical protein